MQIEPHETDKYLLDDDVLDTATAQRSARHARVVPWMRKTEVPFNANAFNQALPMMCL